MLRLSDLPVAVPDNIRRKDDGEDVSSVTALIFKKAYGNARTRMAQGFAVITTLDRGKI